MNMIKLLINIKKRSFSETYFRTSTLYCKYKRVVYDFEENMFFTNVRIGLRVYLACYRNLFCA